MKIGIIGAKGFIGQEIRNHLKEHEVRPIFRDAWKDMHYDIIIDANGSSKKYAAQTDSLADFKASVDSVMYYINHLKYSKYIYISTIDAELPWASHYGFNRLLAENLVRHYCPSWTIVRLCSVIGSDMTKGIVYDVLQGEKLFVTKDSLIHIISVKEVARKISLVLTDHECETLKFYSKEPIEVWDICKMFGKNPIVSPDAETQFYHSDPSDLGFKTAEEYLKEEFQV